LYSSPGDSNTPYLEQHWCGSDDMACHPVLERVSIMEDSSLRVLVVDDSALYRKFVRTALEEFPEVKVVGTASNGKIGLEKIEALKPDLITLDLEMPELCGLAMLREMSVRSIDVATVIISSLSTEGAKATNTALQLGAFDFVLKPIGKGPDESRAQLRADMEPKIRACILALQRKLSNPRSSATARSNRSTAQDLTRKVNVSRNIPQVVGIGISTGGPVALNQLLPKLPGNFPCPILLVQHMPPLFTKSLADDLNRLCALEVKEAATGMTALPGQVLVAPGGKQMKVKNINGRALIQITDDEPEKNCRPAVNYLFRSIAQGYGDRAVGVVMTGMGDDGTEGCKELKLKGAFVLTQAEASCVVYGMPRSVVEAGLSDHVVELDNMAGCLTEAVGQGAVI